MNTIEYILPTHWLSALINDDWSGLDDKEEKEIRDWLNKEGKQYPRFWALCPSEDDDLGFKWRNDANNLGQDCTRVTFDVGEV